MSDVFGIGEIVKIVNSASGFVQWLKATASISGKVFNRAGAPVAGVTVCIGGKESTTTRDGLFIIKDPERELQYVGLKYREYEPINDATQLDIGRGQSFEIEVLLPKEWEEATTEALFSVEGLLQDSEGLPLSSTEIIFDESQTTLTAQNGKFVARLKLGIYNLSVKIDGVVHQNVDWLNVNGDRVDVLLVFTTPGDPESEVEGDDPLVVEVSPAAPTDIVESVNENWWRNSNSQASQPFWRVIDSIESWSKQVGFDLRINWSAKSYVGFWYEGRCLIAAWPQKSGAAVYLPDPSDGGTYETPSAFFTEQVAKLRAINHKLSWAFKYNAGANPLRLVIKPTSLDLDPIRDIFRPALAPFMEDNIARTESQAEEEQENAEDPVSPEDSKGLNETWWRTANHKGSPAYFAVLAKIQEWLETHSIDLRINWSAKSYVGFWHGGRCLLAAWPQKSGAAVYLPDLANDGNAETSSSYFNEQKEAIENVGHKMSWSYAYNGGANPIRVVLTPTSLDLPELSNMLLDVLENVYLSPSSAAGGTSNEEKGSDDPLAQHFVGAKPIVKQIFDRVVSICADIDPQILFNPQKYYVSIRKSKNISYLEIRKTRIRMVALLPEEEVRAMIHSFPITSLSASVQKFYNTECAAITLSQIEHLEEEIKPLLRKILERME